MRASNRASLRLVRRFLLELRDCSRPEHTYFMGADRAVARRAVPLLPVLSRIQDTPAGFVDCRYTPKHHRSGLHEHDLAVQVLCTCTFPLRLMYRTKLKSHCGAGFGSATRASRSARRESTEARSSGSPRRSVLLASQLPRCESRDSYRSASSVICTHSQRMPFTALYLSED